MGVTKLLNSPVEIRTFCPKKSKFGPKMAFLFILGQALQAYLVGGCGVRAVSRKTPIYFIYSSKFDFFSFRRQNGYKKFCYCSYDLCNSSIKYSGDLPLFSQLSIIFCISGPVMSLVIALSSHLVL